MKQETSHLIHSVRTGSAAWYAGLEPGDTLVSVNGRTLSDIFDYYYLTDGADPVLEIRDAEGVLHEVEVEKEEGEDLGLEFDSALLDDYRRCSNSCIFCFIDQMPPGMRDTLYFKDDDTRLSFLQGNYVTLTNLSDEEIDRLIAYRLAPINISVHTTNPELRVRMLKNRFAGNLMPRLQRLYEAQLPMNAQIVLCKGWNDGAELDRTISDLMAFAPVMGSLSVVPVGLTRYREGLERLEPFEKEDARRVLAQIHAAASSARERFGTGFVYAADEWYLLAEEPLPESGLYDGFPQLENGVGMTRLLLDEAASALEKYRRNPSKGGERTRRVTLATGFLAAPFLEQICRDVKNVFPALSARVVPIRNNFFGERITVSGLITGQDLASQLSKLDLGDELLLPVNMLRAGEEVFLDDMTLSELRAHLGVPIRVTGPHGEDLIEALLG